MSFGEGVGRGDEEEAEGEPPPLVRPCPLLQPLLCLSGVTPHRRPPQQPAIARPVSCGKSDLDLPSESSFGAPKTRCASPLSEAMMRSTVFLSIFDTPNNRPHPALTRSVPHFHTSESDAERLRVPVVRNPYCVPFLLLLAPLLSSFLSTPPGDRCRRPAPSSSRV